LNIRKEGSISGLYFHDKFDNGDGDDEMEK
jgi:hypothetical protein